MEMNLEQLRLYVIELEKQGATLGGIKIPDLRSAIAADFERDLAQRYPWLRLNFTTKVY